MNPRWFVYIMLVGLLFWTLDAHAATIPTGYEKLGWAADVAQVSKLYPRGQMVKLGNEVIYKQQKPTRVLARRNFAFNNGKLHAVSCTFEKKYVETKGIVQLLGEQKKNFGEGRVDRSQAPHMITYTWEGTDTRITFAYAPKRPDMTMIMYELKADVAVVDSK